MFRGYGRNGVLSYEVQCAIYEVGSAEHPALALQAFRRNKSILEDWRILYATSEDTGSFKLRRDQFSDQGFVSSIFKGKSLFVLDKDSISSSRTSEFKMGFATYVDSNAASFIEGLAYNEKPNEKTLEFCGDLSRSIALDELSRINPYLYLYEAQRNKSEKHVLAVRRTIAAILAIPLIQRNLDVEWGNKFRSLYQQEAEGRADKLLAEFYRRMDYTSEALERQVDLMEALLVRALIINLSSKRSAEAKFEELLNFMHDEIHTMMIREMIICCDIFFREGRSQITNKLNSLADRKNPFSILRGCAQDIFFARAMDDLSNTNLDPSHGCFYVANIITFDKDLSDILKITALRALGISRKTTHVVPVYDSSVETWMQTHLSSNRLDRIRHIFTEDAHKLRAAQRDRGIIEEVLKNDRARLAELLTLKKSEKRI